ncbi:cysteine-rich repeat secretory protein 4-like [Silene latifolia]|uniref:cysteine-rich repeat secretory protein 4-like n=1 Tax=Silene latifolia TaxID=37657 RepID=UPI003D7701BE
MHKCEKSNDTYIAGTTFESTLNTTLFSILPAKALQATFGNFTNGTGIDQVNALFYCRGNVDTSVCHDCVQAAADKIAKQCRFLKEAIVWFEECTLRYANRSILSVDEEDPVYIYTNTTGIINDDLLNPFADEFDSAMAELIHQAANSRNLQGFATAQLNISSTEDLHFAVQCSPDISGVACQRCLNSGLKQRDKWADTMIFMPSCFIRVDLYNSTAFSIPTGAHNS